jgi:hypothetical protein
MTDRNSDMRHILSQVRTMAGGTIAPLEEARVAVWSGATITVLHNPNAQAFHQMVEKAEGTLRGLLSDDGTDLYVWDAYMAVHPNIQQELGLGNYDCIAYTRGQWRGPVNALNMDTYKPAVERVTPKPGPTPEQKRRDAELLAAIFDDPEFSKIIGEDEHALTEAKAPPASYGYYITDKGRYLPIERGSSHDDCAEDNGVGGKDGASYAGWIRVVHEPGDWIVCQFDGRHVTRAGLLAYAALARQGKYLNHDGSPMAMVDVNTGISYKAQTVRQITSLVNQMVGK